jgi:integrase
VLIEATHVASRGQPLLQLAPQAYGVTQHQVSRPLAHQRPTLLLGRGVHPKMVQHLMGHASIQLTLDRYSHWIPSMGRATAEGMDEALG